MFRRKSSRTKPKNDRGQVPPPGDAKGVTMHVRVPRSGRSGIHWPAIPSYVDAVVLALQHQWEQSQWWPPEALLEHQLRQLEFLVAHATRTVPIYHDRLGALSGLKRGELTMDTFRRLPLLTRTDIQEAGDALLTRRLPEDHGNTFDVSTSGSTGRPITVKGTEITVLFTRAAELRYHLWHGRDLSEKLAKVTRSARATAPEKPATWVPGYGSGLMVSSEASRPVAEQMAWLEKENPGYLLTYPTNLHALLQHCESTGARLPGLKGVVTVGEVLEPNVRAACERVWGLPVVDSYSSQELGTVAMQCPENPHYHVQSESLLVEILDDAGEPCAPGENGRLVITDLHNFATPLIRYEIGDYAEAGGPCPCGRTLPVLTRIVGRIRNMFTLPSGGQIWPAFSKALRDALPPLRQAQLVQRTLDEIEVRLVVARPLTPEDEDRARKALGRALSDEFTFRLVYVDEIPRSPGGKFEEAKCDLGR